MFISKDLVEVSILINIHVCTFLILTGCVGCLLSVLVFVNSIGKAPKIGAVNFLIALSTANFVFLVLHWFINTSQVLSDYYSFLHIIKTLTNFVNTNRLACKTANHLYNMVRCLSTFLTLTFSLERTFAIYYPFRMIKYKQSSNSVIIVLLVVVSFLLSVHYFLSYDTIRTPGGEALCTVHEVDQKLHTILNLIYFTVTFVIPYFFITVLNMALICKLNGRGYSTSGSFKSSSSLLNDASQLKLSIDNPEQFQTLSNYIQVKCACNNHCVLMGKNSLKLFLLGQSKMFEFKFEKKSKLLTIVRKSCATSSSLHNPKRNKINKKILTVLTGLYVVTCLPYLATLIYTHKINVQLNIYDNDKTTTTIKTNDDGAYQSQLIYSYKFHVFISFAEIFYLSNHSISSLLFFSFGKIYRTHLFAFLRKLFGRI